MVSLSAGVKSFVLQMGQTSTRHVCQQVQQQTPQICVPGDGPGSMGSECIEQWENLDVYIFPPVSLLGKVLSKVMDRGCHRMILIAPVCPNMSWFWDLVNLSIQIPFVLPLQEDLVTQPFNGGIHHDLRNLNLHAWLLEPPLFRNKSSLTKW